jgi:hypothetical protein
LKDPGLPRVRYPFLTGYPEPFEGIPQDACSQISHKARHIRRSGSCTIPFLSWPAVAFPTTLYRTLDVRETGLGMEAEVTGKLLRLGIRPYREKLTWRDGVEGLWILAGERFAPCRG